MLDAVSKAVIAQDVATLRKRREGAGEYKPAELMLMARKAANFALSGARFSTEDRVEVAAEILRLGLAETVKLHGPGNLPNRNDPAHGFIAYKRRAGRERDKIEAKRAIESGEAQAPEIGAYDAAHATLMGGAVEAARGGVRTPAQAHAYTVEALDALYGVKRAEHRNVYAVLYAYARDLPESEVYAELGYGALASYRAARSRGRRELVERFPTSRALVEAFAGGRAVEAWPNGEREWWFVLPENVGKVPPGFKRLGDVRRSLMLGKPTREERERGPRIERPEDGDTARAACTVRTVKPTATPVDPATQDEVFADSLVRLSYALSAAR